MAVKKTGYLVGAVAGAGVAAAALAGAGMQWPAARADQNTGLIKASTAPIFAPPPGAPLSFADIFDRVSPAVVSIDVKSRVNRKTLQQIPGFENFPFNIVPKGQGQDGDDQNAPPPQAMSSGSGFFISSDGYIVTYYHGVEIAVEITVTLKDERELKARVIGRDEGTDLAGDLRHIVREQVSAGRSDAQVRAFMAERYGQFVLLAPRFNPGNAALWLTPAVLLAAAGLILVVMRRREAALEPPLTEEEEAEIGELFRSEPVDTVPPNIGPRKNRRLTQT